MIFWGFSFIWSSQLLRYYHPVTIIFIRLIISSALLFALIHLFRQRQSISRADLPLVFFSALFNPFLYFLGENYGLKYSTPTIAAVVIATIPVFSPVVAWIMIREKLTWLNFTGIGISFAGVLLLLVNNNLEFTGDTKGVVFLFCAVLAALFYSVTLKKLTSRYSALNLIAWQNVIGILLFLPLFLVFEARHFLSVPVTAEIIRSFLFLAVLASSVAFVFFAHSIKLLGVSKSNVFSNLIPVFTAIFSFFLLDEAFTWRKITGILIVIVGVFLSEQSKISAGKP